jgi:NAD(P)-dependent dehydrogenase (short-subunit alcohol dehydrogenase family)
MLLKDKNAVIYGGGGSIVGAVARAFAREGANVFLAGRAATLEDVGNAAAFAASERASTMTAATVNISCGALVD